MPVPLDKFTDKELLTLCALADEVRTQFDLGKPLTVAETGFLAMMRAKKLWTPETDGQAV